MFDGSKPLVHFLDYPDKEINQVGAETRLSVVPALPDA
jgi:hypothetical protein